MVVRSFGRQRYDFDRDCVRFHAWAGDRKIVCRVSREAFEDDLGALHEELIDSFKIHQHTIEAKARELIQAGRFEANGTILIRSGDLRAILRKG